jgi:hypothetical protein
MRHITIASFDTPPCNGEIHYITLTPTTDESRSAGSANRSLPILGQRAAAELAPAGEWVCGRCGQKWAFEPQPYDAL